ncbi:MAG TPA: hypothetical protein VJU86_21535 [Pyrinomonadaceae bacterium]|nr:hypothetical protein [Pyrinomonadaceae bacterium]
MFVFAFAKHPIVSYSDGRGGTITYYYYDEYTWIVAALALAWLTWFLVSRYRRARAMRRPPRRSDHRTLNRVVKIKNELSQTFLRPGFSRTIHAVGIGMLPGAQYCIHVFLNDLNEEIWVGAGAAPLPGAYHGVPLVPIEMPVASFLSGTELGTVARPGEYSRGIREHQEIIIGGISGANTHLTGQSGTIGYFCTRKSKLRRRKEVHLLSNAHVFVDLRRTEVDDSDLIMQPSPGEPASNRPIGALVNYSALTFNGEVNEPNHVDAAIAKLWDPQPHKPLIPLIGAVKGYVPKKDIDVGEAVRKFGRTTGYTEGRIFSIYLDIWIRYDRTGLSAFFDNQILIAPALPRYAKFVSKGDSGSLVVDAKQHAVGLIFGGMSELPESFKASPGSSTTVRTKWPGTKPQKIESYGVANPISEVMDRMKIELVI